MMEDDMQVRDILASHGAPGAAERALVRALLEDAIGCLGGRIGQHRERRRLAVEARRWIEDDDRTWPFSFENVCDTLEIDADHLRTRLLRAAAPEATCTVDRPVAVQPALGVPMPVEDDVMEMIRAGVPLRRVAERFGISISKVSVLSCGLASRIKAERDLQIHALRQQGWTYRALAAEFGLSRIRVMRICTRAGRVTRTAA